MMNAKQYRKALERLELTQVAAGEMLQVGARTSRRFALGESKIPGPVVMLLDLMLKKQLELVVPVVNEETGKTLPDTHRIWTFSAKSVPKLE